MSWKDDAFGKTFRARDFKLYFNGHHTWKMKLSQIHRQSGTIRLITYSLPRVGDLIDLFERRSNDVFLICHEKFLGEAQQLKQAFPLLEVATHPWVHSKVCLIEPDTIYVGSANMGRSKLVETVLGVRSKEALDAYVENAWKPLWAEATRL